MNHPIANVALNALQHFSHVLHPNAVRIFTPFTTLTPLDACRISTTLRAFLQSYEPKIKITGLFPHQAGFLEAYSKGSRNFIITTATGSGKSLCFLAWIFDQLLSDTRATALICFPTQALMWGQAERLARLSDPSSLAKYRGNHQNQPAFGGSIPLGSTTVTWTIWYGGGRGRNVDKPMKEHEQSRSFQSARIRLATLDKAHWSLFRSREGKDFVARLRCLCIDEAHTYDGVFGANVHYFIKRLYLATDILGNRRPFICLASATLSSARTFATQLLSLGAHEITHIEDSARQEITLIPLSDVALHLENPPVNGLLRVVVLLNDQATQVSLQSFMRDETLMGKDVNAIYFSPSKMISKLLKSELEKTRHSRSYVIYDADLPPNDRRDMERELNDPSLRARTVLATSALELGVDIEGLDICLMDQIPARRSDLLQRIGRVGRRQGRAGLVLLRLGPEPHDQAILENPQIAFRLDSSRPMPIPIHLEPVKWRHMMAAFMEWMNNLRYNDYSWNDFNDALQRHFGEAPRYGELKMRLEDKYGGLSNMQDKEWAYKGFRASAGQGKIPLRDGDREVARIEDINVFRDAHPEAVFLGHDLKRYRVVSYALDWKRAIGDHATGEFILRKWLPALEAIQVQVERRNIVTRGRWQESFTFYEAVPLHNSRQGPTIGQFRFGIWDFTRKWKGYIEIHLGSNRVRKVDLKEVTERFKDAMDQGRDFPFLYPLSYRTFGWEWDFGDISAHRGTIGSLSSLANVVSSLLEHFFADVVQSRPSDLDVQLDLGGHVLRIVDATLGGNGLSEALLSENRMLEAFQACGRTVSRFLDRDGQVMFEKYVLNLCHQKTSHSVHEVLTILDELSRRWSGQQGGLLEAQSAARS